MSVVKYNSLIFEIRERLDELNVGRKLHFMCRGKVAPRSEENMQNASSLITELEEKEFLGPDNLDLLKDLLKDVKEWAFLEEVEKFESKRKEYFDLLEQIIRALDELNDLERLVSICRGKIPRERQGNICDARSLFEELEINNCLGINRLGILKELLAQTGTDDLLLEVKEFDERRTREDKFERRKARAAEIVSTARNNLTGVLTIKNVFKGVAGGMVIYSAFDLLRRHPTYDQLVNAINNCILPAGAKLIEMAEGSVNLKVHAENRLALDNLWRMYKNGTLKAGLQALLVTDEMIEFAGGEVEVTVTIDEEEYIKARGELTTESTDDPLGKEEKRLKYMGLDKYDYIQNYLEQAREQTKDIDSHSVMTETSDSGLLGSNSASSEVGTEEAGDSVCNPCLKDIRQEVTNELTSKLKSDRDILDRFYRSFGLDPMKLHTKDLVDIKDIFPDTPVKVLKDVFKALQMYDFVELLEKATKPRALRPALLLKEIEKLPNANNRPTKFFTKAEVLIIDSSDDADENPQNFGSFFKALNPQCQVIAVAAENCIELRKDLKRLRELNDSKCSSILYAKNREQELKEALEKKVPVDHGRYMVGAGAIYRELKNEELLTLFEEKESKMKEDLEKLIEEIERLTKESNKITKDLEKKNEELQAEYEKFNGAVSTHFNKWMEQAYVKGNESTLFVVVIANRLESGYFSEGFFKRAKIVNDCLKEKLPLIPQTKVVIISDPSRLMNPGEIPSETLQVYLPRRVGLGTVLELLNKRYKSLDLIAVILELKRSSYLTPYGKGPYYHHYGGWFSPLDVTVDFYENLSCLPRLQKTEQL